MIGASIFRRRHEQLRECISNTPNGIMPCFHCNEDTIHPGNTHSCRGADISGPLCLDSRRASPELDHPPLPPQGTLAVAHFSFDLPLAVAPYLVVPLAVVLCLVVPLASASAFAFLSAFVHVAKDVDPVPPCRSQLQRNRHCQRLCQDLEWLLNSFRRSKDCHVLG